MGRSGRHIDWSDRVDAAIMLEEIYFLEKRHPHFSDFKAIGVACGGHDYRTIKTIWTQLETGRTPQIAGREPIVEIIDRFYLLFLIRQGRDLAWVLEHVRIDGAALNERTARDYFKREARLQEAHPGAIVEPWTTPDGWKAVVAEIDKAVEFIMLSMYILDQNQIVEALVEAHCRRGVLVIVLTDRDNAKAYPWGIHRLACLGIRILRAARTDHDKLMFVDYLVMMLGTGNFTPPGTGAPGRSLSRTNIEMNVINRSKKVCTDCKYDCARNILNTVATAYFAVLEEIEDAENNGRVLTALELWQWVNSPKAGSASK